MNERPPSRWRHKRNRVAPRHARFLTRPEAAEYLGISLYILQRFIDRGFIPITEGFPILISRNVLDQLLDQCRQEGYPSIRAQFVKTLGVSRKREEYPVETTGTATHFACGHEKTPQNMRHYINDATQTRREICLTCLEAGKKTQFAPRGGHKTENVSPTLFDRFWRCVVQVPTRDGTCWVWTGPKFRPGSGYFNDKYQKISASRYAYEFFRSSLSPSQRPHRFCQERECVNPWHRK